MPAEGEEIVSNSRQLDGIDAVAVAVASEMDVVASETITVANEYSILSASLRNMVREMPDIHEETMAEAARAGKEAAERVGFDSGLLGGFLGGLTASFLVLGLGNLYVYMSPIKSK